MQSMNKCAYFSNNVAYLCNVYAFYGKFYTKMRALICALHQKSPIHVENAVNGEYNTCTGTLHYYLNSIRICILFIL